MQKRNRFTEILAMLAECAPPCAVLLTKKKSNKRENAIGVSLAEKLTTLAWARRSHREYPMAHRNYC